MVVEVSNHDEHNSGSDNKNKLIGNLQSALHMYLTIGNDSPVEQNETIDDFLDGMKILKTIDVDTLDEKDKILLGLLKRSFDIVSDVQNIMQTANLTDRELLIEQHYIKEVKFERDWTYTIFNLLLAKQIDLLDNRLGLDMHDFVGIGAMVLSKYKGKDNNVDWQAQLTDFFGDYLGTSPLLVNLVKVKNNNDIPDDIFAQRLIENFDYFYALCEEKNLYFIGYISLVLIYLGCTQEQISNIQEKYYGIHLL